MERGLHVPGDAVVRADRAHHRGDEGVGRVGQTREEVVLGLVIEAAGVPAKESAQGTRAVGEVEARAHLPLVPLIGRARTGLGELGALDDVRGLEDDAEHEPDGQHDPERAHRDDPERVVEHRQAHHQGHEGRLGENGDEWPR